jgi:hypothetical protein
VFCTWGFGQRADAPADAEAATFDAVVELLLQFAA